MEDQLTRMVIGAAIEVHKELGPGLLESVYENALIQELYQQGLSAQSQLAINVAYKENPLGIGFRMDLLVEQTVAVEIKSVNELMDVHFAQLLTYLKLSDLKLGLLINFNVPLIKHGIRRIVNGH